MDWRRRINWSLVGFFVVFTLTVSFFIFAIATPPVNNIWFATVVALLWPLAVILSFLPRKKICNHITVVNGQVYYPGESRQWCHWLRDEVRNLENEISYTPVNTWFNCLDGKFSVRIYPGVCEVDAAGNEKTRQLDVDMFLEKVQEHLKQSVARLSEDKHLSEAIIAISNDDFSTTIDGLKLEWCGNTIIRFDLYPTEEK